MVERCHTILADIFPHEGTKKIGGSRVFIRVPLLVVLKDSVKAIRNELGNWADVEARNDIALLWAEVVELLARLEKEGCDGNAQKIDEAVTLLYLASGATWNYLRAFTTDEPPHNPQYVRVEPMLPLLKRCGHESKIESGIEPKQLVERLRTELNVCLR